jgi:alpha-mannosidase
MAQDKVGNPERPLPSEGASFLETDQPNVVVVTWKRAEDGNGTILRLYETAGREATATLRFLRTPLRAAHLTNAVEDNLSSLATDGNAVPLTFRPHEVVTVRVQ